MSKGNIPPRLLDQEPWAVLAHLKTLAERDERLLRDSAALTLRRYCQELILDLEKVKEWAEDQGTEQ